MTKAIFGIAAALALATTPARAEEDMKTVENVSSDSSTAEMDAPKGKVAARTVSGSRNLRAAPADTSSREVKPADQGELQVDDWLITREGYRDGGY